MHAHPDAHIQQETGRELYGKRKKIPKKAGGGTDENGGMNNSKVQEGTEAM